MKHRMRGERGEWRSFVFDCFYDPVRRRGHGRVTVDRVRSAAQLERPR